MPCDAEAIRKEMLGEHSCFRADVCTDKPCYCAQRIAELANDEVRRLEVELRNQAVVIGALKTEDERLQDAKRRALAIADERSKAACELRAENARLRAVADAARLMPRTTAKGGAASTKHTYQIEAAYVWALDRALKALDEQSTDREG